MKSSPCINLTKDQLAEAGLSTEDVGRTVSFTLKELPDGGYELENTEAEPAGEELERLRILARTPRWGREIDDGILPAEAGLDGHDQDHVEEGQKVGYVVKPDGVMGAGTKQAIEKFERDRGLPVTGQLAGRTLKDLASQSGIAIP